MYHGRDLMAREYKLKRRAESQDETRQRIVEATIALHQTVGPAATTISDIAERAGVGRVTVYRHFPDEPTLARACSGLYFERHPAPDPDRWRAIPEPTERLRTGLRETYAYHRIRGAVMDMLRALDWLPRSLRQKETRLADAVTRLETLVGTSLR